MRRVDIDGVAVAVYQTEAGEFFATQDTCTHAQASLVAGELDGCEVECPLHGARFDLTTGAALCLPAFEPLVTYAVRVHDGAIWVCVDRPPTLP
jgi:3-phenylpropionate/trans-cinnamate dioxygenase ferredoxin component